MVDEHLKQKVNRYLINETEFLKYKETMNEEEMRDYIKQGIAALCEDQKMKLEDDEFAYLVRTLVSDNVSLGPLKILMNDDTVTEIMINGPKQIYVQREGRIGITDVKFEDSRHLSHTIQKILNASGTNKRVDESSPYVDFSMTDGSRVNVIIPPLTTIGPVITIRKFRDDIDSVDDLIKLQEIDDQIAILLTNSMKAKLNVVFCGSTGAGKTTALNVFSRHIPEEERIITIEDTPELILNQEHVVTLVSRPPNLEGKGDISMRDLFINSLRMRPDRVIVGEVRGGEMLDLIESISSGHSGSLAIVHAETPKDCFNRMVTMMLMTGIRLSTEEIQKQIATAIDLLVHVELFMDGKRRMTNVTDIYYDEQKEKVIFHDVFKFVQTGMEENGDVIGTWRMDKKLPSFYHKFKKRMVKVPDGFFDKE